MGFTKVATHRSKDVHLYRQGGINLILNNEPKSIASYFAAEHGPSVCGMAFRVRNAHQAYARALAEKLEREHPEEVVSRMQHRGGARTRIVGIDFDTFAPEPGVPVIAGEKTIGTMGSGAGGRGPAIP